MKLDRLSAHDVQAAARHVEAQIKKLEHRPRPTPTERDLTRELKRLRLNLKDRLADQER